jgi:regulatory protein
MSTDSASSASIQFSAMSYLAMREHSAYELQQKLLTKFEAPELILRVIDDLKARDLQSDSRFSEAFVKMRMRQGKGPVRIQHELKEKRVGSELVIASVDETSSVWDELARDVRCKRFGEAPPIDHRDKAKQQRFLQYRGFSIPQIQAAF